jgi:hypothetical protein
MPSYPKVTNQALSCPFQHAVLKMTIRRSALIEIATRGEDAPRQGQKAHDQQAPWHGPRCPGVDGRRDTARATRSSS